MLGEGLVKAAVAIIVWGALVCGGAISALAQGSNAEAAGACAKQDFEAVVEGAAGSLRDLTQRNTPGFQDKLRLLRERRKWSAEEFMERASPFVQDETITTYDQRSNDLLQKLNSMGEVGAQSKTPDCKLLDDLRKTMRALLETQIEKWAYMFAKIERGLVN